MKQPRGFAWLPVLIIAGLVILGGGAWLFKSQQHIPTPGAGNSKLVDTVGSLGFSYGSDSFRLTKQDTSYTYRTGSEANLRAYIFFNTSAAGPLIHEGVLNGVNTQVVLLWRSSGANIIEPILFAFQQNTNKNPGVWEQVAATKLPDDGGRTTVDGMEITNNTITINVKTSGPDRNYHDTYVPKQYMYMLASGKLLLKERGGQ